MQVPLEAAASLVLGRHQPMTRLSELDHSPAQLILQARTVKHESRLRGKTVHQALLSRAQRLTRSSRYRQPAEIRTRVLQQDASRRNLRCYGLELRKAARSDFTAVFMQPHGGGVRAGALRKHLRHDRQQLQRVLPAVEASREVGQDLIRNR